MKINQAAMVLASSAVVVEFSKQANKKHKKLRG